jgi:hypothetical protein
VDPHRDHLCRAGDVPRWCLEAASAVEWRRNRSRPVLLPVAGSSASPRGKVLNRNDSCRFTRLPRLCAVVFIIWAVFLPRLFRYCSRGRRRPEFEESPCANEDEMGALGHARNCMLMGAPSCAVPKPHLRYALLFHSICRSLSVLFVAKCDCVRCEIRRSPDPTALKGLETFRNRLFRFSPSVSVVGFGPCRIGKCSP